MREDLWADIRRLRLHEKLSRRAIARRLCIHPDTVARALASEQCPRPAVGSRGSLLDEYDEVLRSILLEYPDLTGVRVLEKLRDLGYTGGITILRDRLRELRPRRRLEAFLRRETLPGQEAQADWGSCGTILHEGAFRPLSVFVMALSYSRMLYIEFTTSQEMEDFLRCHVNAFEFFGGVPRTILYDNLRSVVTWRQGRFTRFNRRFVEFAGTFPFEARPCNKGKGNEKPRAETGVRYVKQNFLAGRHFEQLYQVQVAAFHWLTETANRRVHRTTGERPCERLEREKPALQPLPASGYDTRIYRSVYVTHQARVSFQANTYSVPPRHVGQMLTLKASPERLWLYDGDIEVASHVRTYGRFKDVEDPAHARAILATKQRGHLDKERDLFLSLGEPARKFLEGLVTRGHSIPALHIQKVLGLVERHGKTYVLDALSRANSFGAYGAEYVENILRELLGPDTLNPGPDPLVLIRRPDLTSCSVEETNWSDYQPLTPTEDTDEEEPES